MNVTQCTKRDRLLGHVYSLAKFNFDRPLDKAVRKILIGQTLM